jgi:ABC-type amino acid transport substrate-binding protein
VDADHVVDDELQAGQADAAVGDLGEFEGQLRVAHVHHDLDRDVGQVAGVGGDDLEVQLAA